MICTYLESSWRVDISRTIIYCNWLPYGQVTSCIMIEIHPALNQSTLNAITWAPGIQLRPFQAWKTCNNLCYHLGWELGTGTWLAFSNWYFTLNLEASQEDFLSTHTNYWNLESKSPPNQTICTYLESSWRVHAIRSFISCIWVPGGHVALYIVVCWCAPTVHMVNELHLELQEHSTCCLTGTNECTCHVLSYGTGLFPKWSAASGVCECGSPLTPLVPGRPTRCPSTGWSYHVVYRWHE